MFADEADFELLCQILAMPTAPFHEHHVLRFVRKFAKEMGFSVESDVYGNLAVRVGGVPRRRSAPPVVLEAHLDHPGFHVESVDDGCATMAFLGKGPAFSVVGEAVEIWGDDQDLPLCRGRVVSEEALTGFYRSLRVRVELDLKTDPARLPERGDFAVWDLPGPHRDGHYLKARAHDDLAEVAAILCTLRRIRDAKVDAHVVGLLTRAEEVGFIGAYGATLSGILPPEAVVVSLECSGMPVQRGFVVRHGDKTAAFDGWATTRLLELADREAAEHEAFCFEAAVPRRGTCNASLYVTEGWPATGLTLPMQNYHNWGDGCVAPETIDTRDWASLVHFLGVTAREFGSVAGARERARSKMLGLWDAERANL